MKGSASFARAGDCGGIRDGPHELACDRSGLVGAAMLALGLGLIVPLGGGIGDLCEPTGIASAMVFIGLMDGQ